MNILFVIVNCSVIWQQFLNHENFIILQFFKNSTFLKFGFSGNPELIERRKTQTEIRKEKAKNEMKK